jgi:hypothetical protein
MNREYPARGLFRATAPTRVLKSFTNVVDPLLDALVPDLERVRSHKVMSFPPRADQLDLAVTPIAELVTCAVEQTQDFVRKLDEAPACAGCRDGERLNDRATVVTADAQPLSDLARHVALWYGNAREQSGERVTSIKIVKLRVQAVTVRDKRRAHSLTALAHVERAVRSDRGAPYRRRGSGLEPLADRGVGDEAEEVKPSFTT